jgi:nucleoside 2-deoxyribosyltransferase
MRQAAEQVRAVCERVDRREFQGSVVDEIQRLIRQSVAVIVDLSEAKPNVLYEAGYAHALNKPCIHICSTSTEKLPFDVSHWKTTMYHPGHAAQRSSNASTRRPSEIRTGIAIPTT